jgi:hypothetical protein
MKNRTINEYRQVKDTVYVAPQKNSQHAHQKNGQPNQIIKDIHLENMGFVQYDGGLPLSYYKEYGGLRLDAVMGDDYNNLSKMGWNIVIFHDSDPTKMTIIKDLDLFIELNNLLNKIRTRYDEAKSH